MNPRLAGEVLDGTGLAVSVAVLVTMTIGDGSIVRTVAATLFLCLVPGWTIVRLTGAEASLLTLLVAVASSIAILMITGELLVTRAAWNWRLAAWILSWGCLAGLGSVMMRRHRDG